MTAGVTTGAFYKHFTSKEALFEEIIQPHINALINMYNEEFKALRNIGNNFRIRHHETTKVDITDDRQYDYFYKRCLALISTAVQYLEKRT